MSFPDLTRHFSYLLAETVDCLHLEEVEWVCAINLDSIGSFFSVTTCYVTLAKTDLFLFPREVAKFSSESYVRFQHK